MAEGGRGGCPNDSRVLNNEAFWKQDSLPWRRFSFFVFAEQLPDSKKINK